MSTPQSVCITVRGCWAMQAASQGLPGNNTAAHTLRNGHSSGPTTPGSQQQQSPGGPLPDSSVLGVHLGWGNTLAPAERSASGSLGPLPPGLPLTSAIARASSQSLYNSPFGSGFGSAGGASRPPSGRLPDNLGFGVVGAPRSVGLPSGPRHCHRRSMDMLGRQARGRPPQIIPVQLEPVHVQTFEVASRFENFLLVLCDVAVGNSRDTILLLSVRKGIGFRNCLCRPQSTLSAKPPLQGEAQSSCAAHTGHEPHVAAAGGGRGGMVAGPGQRRPLAGRCQRCPGAGASAGPAPGHRPQWRPADGEGRQRRHAPLPARFPRHGSPR